MKNIFKYILAVTVVSSMTFSCEEDLVVFDNSSFIQLQSAADAVITENSGDVVNIVAILGAPQASDITVNFDVTGDAARYTLSASSVVIPAGETTSDVVTFEAVDDDEINGDVEIVVALATSSGLPVGIGGEGVNAVSKSITIIDDNVPCNNYVVTIVTDRWGSEAMWDILDANGDVVVSGGPFTDGPADSTSTDEVNINLEDGCYTLRVFDWYGDSWSSGGPASYTAVCGNLVAVNGDDTFDGIPGLDINTVPVNPLYGSTFRAGSATSGAAPYAGHAEQVEFCVNQ